MPRKISSKVSRNIKASKSTPVESYVPEQENIASSSADQPRRKISPILLILPFLIAALALVLWRNKGLIVAATVNSQPIWRWNMEALLNERYGASTLDEMVDRQIIKSEADKKGITISDKEIDAKIAELEKTLQGRVTLKDALAQQGLTYDEFRKQVELQLIIEKLTTNVTVSDKDITDYITANKDALPATDEATLKTQVKDTLLRQKRSESFRTLFEELKKNAKVTKFL